jgi:hypothetical protein
VLVHTWQVLDKSSHTFVEAWLPVQTFLNFSFWVQSIDHWLFLRTSIMTKIPGSAYGLKLAVKMTTSYHWHTFTFCKNAWQSNYRCQKYVNIWPLPHVEVHWKSSQKDLNNHICSRPWLCCGRY